MLKKLFVAWQDPVSRAWFAIAQLTYSDNRYQFTYIRGVKEACNRANFPGLWSFPNLEKVYESPELFPFFSNRVLRRSRPDYPDYIRWLNLPEGSDHPMAMLSRSGGTKLTDNFALFPYPEADDRGRYHLYFCAHGLRYMPSATNHRILQLQVGERLLMMHDAHNEYDRLALMLRTEDFHLVGYCPRYLLDEIFNLLRQTPQAVTVTVERVNPPPAPLQMRLLCHLTVDWNEFEPFSSPMYQPLPEAIAPQLT
ncbi:HIRAN domain-containing protein [Phormidium sp. CCY1219]|uniref:HIRAN domain-containing protein n=1 Tax=Phormidium sp. CCY1219 TaxID=2886104 RepID=UPI002D1F7D6E|nr:HIRAN domain-containing protein [Phormidium sp. CCY1219]MEB3827644.1 HIRAN domain-containing protein [Phormidium sp. CCY1219]